MQDWRNYEEAMALRSDRNMLETLNNLFDCTFGKRDGVHTLRYRADNPKDIPMLDALDRHQFISIEHQCYTLQFISIIYLADNSEKAAGILENCEKIYNTSKEHYVAHLTEPINLESYSRKTGIPVNDITIAMRYFSGARIFAGRPVGFPDSEDTSITISESVFEHECFQELIAQKKNWFPPIKIENISSPEVLSSAIRVVIKALAEARSLEEKGNASSAVDRVHTAFHAYLGEVCKDFDIEVGDKRPTSSALFKLIQANHPAFQEKGPRASDVKKMLQSIATTINASTPIRNKASLAHANTLLDEPEARAVINSIYTVFRYIQDCLARQERIPNS